MSQSYTRQSSFADGDTITAALFNNEYNQLVNAFSYSSTNEGTTGHRHDGSAGEGGNIPQIGDLDFLNKIVVDSTNNRWGFYVQVASSAVEQLRLQDGALIPVTDSDIDLGTTSLRFKDTYTDTITTTGNVSIGGNLTVTGNATISGNLTFGDADTDSINLAAEIDSHIVPNTDDTYDLGTSTKQWRNLYIDGTAEIDTLAINGTTVTSTAAELNILDGVTSTAAELNILDGVTSTTAEINLLDGVTSTTAELNILDGVTATSTEINILDGVTSTTAELNILDGVTANATEINLLDGVTSTTAELNILDGVTSTAAELNILDGKAFLDEDNMASNSATGIASQQSIKAYVDAQVTAQDLDIITDSGNIAIDLDSENLTISGGTGIDSSATGDAVTLAIDSTVTTLSGTQTLLNKTLTSPDINTPDIDGGTIDGTIIGGSSAAAITGTAITGTSFVIGSATITEAELEILDGATVTTSELNILDGVTSTAAELNILDGKAFLDEDDMSSNSATGIASQQSIKAYVDSTVAATNEVVEDSTPQLGGDLDLNSNDITGTGNINVTGTIQSSGNITGTLATAAQPNITSLGTLTTLTVDDITINGSTISDSGDLTVDVGGRINLSADDNGEVRLYDGSSLYGQFKDDDDRFSIQGLKEDKDMLFVVNDSGTMTTALKLDAANGGDATFYGNINASGNIGIGTTSPSAPLHVAGAFNTTAPTGNGVMMGYFLDSYGYMHLNGPSGAYIDFSASGTDYKGRILYDNTSNYLSLSTNGSEAMRIDSSGKVGISTTASLSGSDYGMITIKKTGSNIFGDSAITINSADTDQSTLALGLTGSVAYIDSTESGNGTVLPLAFATGSTERMRIDSSGNVGIGVSPSSWASGDTILQIKAGSGTTALWGRNNTGRLITNAYYDGSNYRYSSTGTATSFENNVASGGFTWSGASSGSAGAVVSFSERMRIDSSGNVGIGTSSPAEKLQVNGNLMVGDDLTAGSFVDVIGAGANQDFGFRFGGESDRDSKAAILANTSGGLLKFFTSGNNERMRIDASGNVEIGGTTNTGSLKIINTSADVLVLDRRGSDGTVVLFRNDDANIGGISISGSTVAYNTSSDYRLKENVDYNFTALDRVAQLKPARFNFIADETNTLVDGFLAHEVSSIVPEAIKGTKDAVDSEGNPEYQGIDQSKLVPLLTKAIQEQQTQIEALQSEINKLKGE